MCITLSLVATVTLTFVRSKGEKWIDPTDRVPFASSGFDASADLGGGAGGVTGTGVPGGGGGGRYRSTSKASTARDAGAGDAARTATGTGVPGGGGGGRYRPGR